MKILYLSPSANLGGAERVLLSMSAVLRRRFAHLDLHVLTLGTGPLNLLLEEQGIDTIALTIPESLASLGDSPGQGAGRTMRLMCRALAAIPGIWQVRQRLRQIVADLRPDLLHSNGIKTHVLSYLAGIDRIPTLWHVHDFYGARLLAARLLTRAARRVRGAVAVSQAVAADFACHVGSAPLTVIPNAIDVERFRPQSRDGSVLDRLAQLPPSPPETVRIGLVATYARWKGHDIFLQAAAEIVRTRLAQPVRFYVIGGPVYQTQGSQFQEQELRTQARELGLQDAVGFIGFQQRPELIYPALDVVVHASTRPEPFGLTIVEAMACGCAVIATRAGGAAEIIDDGYNALGVPPGDIPALMRALRALLSDTTLRARLGAQARQAALLRFDQDRLATPLWNLYRQTVADPPAQPTEWHTNENVSLQGIFPIGGDRATDPS
jgi:glycosyltransferase involved in cell wall biosynthesis